jgi:hypothetical protein
MIAWAPYLLVAIFGIATIIFLRRFLQAKMRQRDWILAYLCVIALGVSLFFFHGAPDLRPIPKINYRASRALPLNHLVMEADLEEPEGVPGDLQMLLPDSKLLIGKYLLTAHTEGQPILTSDLAASPLIQVPSGDTIWTVTTDLKGVPDYLDAGKPVLVFGDACITSATVAAAHCGSDGCKSMDIFAPVTEVARLSSVRGLKLLAANPGEACPKATGSALDNKPDVKNPKKEIKQSKWDNQRGGNSRLSTCRRQPAPLGPSAWSMSKQVSCSSSRPRDNGNLKVSQRISIPMATPWLLMAEANSSTARHSAL